MPELKFTHYFKHQLAQDLKNYFIENKINLDVKPEYRALVGEEENRIDVAITTPTNDNLLIGIEIEVVSGTDQIFKNYHKFRKWVHASPSRKGALLHIMTDNTNILQGNMYELLIESYNDTAKGLNFIMSFL